MAILCLKPGIELQCFDFRFPHDNELATQFHACRPIIFLKCRLLRVQYPLSTLCMFGWGLLAETNPIPDCRTFSSALCNPILEISIAVQHGYLAESHFSFC